MEKENEIPRAEEEKKTELNFISDTDSSDEDEKMKKLLEIIETPVESQEKSKEEEEKSEPIENNNEEQEYSAEEKEINKDLIDFEAVSKEAEKVVNNIQESSEEEYSEKAPTEPPKEIEAPKPKKVLGNPELIEKLRKRRESLKKDKKVNLTDVLSADFFNNQDPSLTILPPSGVKGRNMLRRQMQIMADKQILDEARADRGNEIQDEEFEEEEEEEEEKKEGEGNAEGETTEGEKKELDPLSKVVVEKLNNEIGEDTELTEEEIEKKIYQDIVNMRLAVDIEEIKKVIRIITGEWRSGKLRGTATAGGDSIDGAFQGNQEENKKLAEKRTMRNQRRKQRIETQLEALNGNTMEQLIQKAMWIQKANSEDATWADKLRARQAFLADGDQRKAVLEDMEFREWQREQRLKEYEKWKEKAEKNKDKSNKKEFSNKNPAAFAPVGPMKKNIDRKASTSFTYIREEAEKPVVKFKEPEKIIDIPEAKSNKKLAEFLSRSNSLSGRISRSNSTGTDNQK